VEDQSARIDIRFLDELKQYGEFNVQNCFSCGHCTAVCNLVQAGEGFPRRMIRYAQLGLRDQLAAAKAVWSCYYCGECTVACPRQATPGQFMDAARRYFNVHWDVTTLSRRFYTSPTFTWAFMAVLAVILAILFLATGGRMVSERLALFEFMNYDFLHYLGIVVMALVGLILMINLANIARQIIKVIPRPPGSGPDTWIRDGVLAVTDVVEELILQKRFDECKAIKSETSEPWYMSRRIMHLTIMWGFLGLLGATTFDFLFKEPGSQVPLYYPARLLGTLAGLLLLYGTSLALWLRRERRGGLAFEKSYLSDWLLLWLLWATTLSGYITEIAVYLPQGSVWGYLIFLVHAIMALELLLLLPFTKFSHVIYRPFALYLHALLLRRRARCLPLNWPASRYRPGGVASST
jgi:nitrate reductase gamma subunit/ferredoxin